MDFIKGSKKFLNQNSKIKNWNHSIQKGINVFTLMMLTWKHGIDKYHDDAPCIIIETRNHYTEKFEKEFLNQPEISFLMIKKKVIREITKHIIKNYSGTTPAELHCLVYCWKSGNNYMYNFKFSEKEEGVHKVIEMIENHDFKTIRDVFKSPKKKLKEWL